MNEETHQKLMTIKRSFRLLMNGPGSQSMRDKGLGYKLNWGVPFYELKKMAEEYGKDYDLAIELWKEDIRECKILATLIMPADKMLPEITDLWMEQVQSQEMAEMLAFNLLQHVDYAPVIAYQWIASDKPLYEIASISSSLPVSLPMEKSLTSVASTNSWIRLPQHCRVTTWE